MVSFDYYEVPTHARFLLKLRFHVKFFDVRVSALLAYVSGAGI
jgi:hypothetical protein